MTYLCESACIVHIMIIKKINDICIHVPGQDNKETPSTNVTPIVCCWGHY